MQQKQLGEVKAQTEKTRDALTRFLRYAKMIVMNTGNVSPSAVANKHANSHMHMNILGNPSYID